MFAFDWRSGSSGRAKPAKHHWSAVGCTRTVQPANSALACSSSRGLSANQQQQENRHHLLDGPLLKTAGSVQVQEPTAQRHVCRGPLAASVLPAAQGVDRWRAQPASTTAVHRGVGVIGHPVRPKVCTQDQSACTTSTRSVSSEVDASGAPQMHAEAVSCWEAFAEDGEDPEMRAGHRCATAGQAGISSAAPEKPSRWTQQPTVAHERQPEFVTSYE